MAQQFTVTLRWGWQIQNTKKWLADHLNGRGDAVDSVQVTEDGPSDLIEVRFWDPEIQGANPEILIVPVNKQRIPGLLRQDFEWTVTQIALFQEGFGDMFKITLPNKTVVYWARSINANHNCLIVQSA